MRRGVSIILGVLACAAAGLLAAAVVASPGLSQLPITTGTTTTLVFFHLYLAIAFAASMQCEHSGSKK